MDGVTAQVRHERPPLPVWIEVDGQAVEAFVTAWSKGSGDSEWTASVAWSQPREDGVGRGNHLGSRRPDQLRPRPS